MDQVRGSDQIRSSYDAVAGRYAEQIGPELATKPVDRALYRLFAELVHEMAGSVDRPLVGDIGCGPGHVAEHLSRLGLQPIGVDLSPGMITVARERYPQLEFHVGDFASLPFGDRALAGAVVPYSIIHVEPAERLAAWRELARVLLPGGWLLVAFHVEAPEQPRGSTYHVTDWWGYPVDLDFHLLDPNQISAELTGVGFDPVVRTDREPWPDIEHPSRRSYLLARLRIARRPSVQALRAAEQAAERDPVVQ